MSHSSVSSEANLFKNIADLALFIDASQDATETYRHLTRGVCEHSQWDISSIQIFDEAQGRTIPIVRFDPETEGEVTSFEGWDASISPVASVLESGELLILNDAAEQEEFPGFRQDARARGYHTSVIIPLDVCDENHRPMVYNVASRSIVDLKPSDISFLQCVADLSSIAIRKVQRIEKEKKEVHRLRAILESMTDSLALTLDNDAAESLAVGLSGLFPSGWLAVDLTSGRGLFDPAAPPPLPLKNNNRMPDEVITAALSVHGKTMLDITDLRVNDTKLKVRACALKIDATHVGSLFFFGTSELSEHESTSAQAGRLALSSFILRSFVEFKAKRTTARRLLTRLVSQDWHDPEEIQDEAHQLEFDLSSPFRLLVLCTDRAEDFTDSAQSFILRSAQQNFGPTISCVMNDKLVMLVNVSKKSIGKKKRSEFLKRIKPLVSQQVLLVMSDVSTDIRQLSQFYESCKSILVLGQTMGIVGWVSSANVGSLPVLLASVDMNSVSDFLDRLLEPLLKKGEKKSRVAIDTIATFLRTGRRYQETADTLNIHVSTLRYRLETLKEQAGIDFDDPDVCFELDLAIRLLNLKST
ncbi:helix-turn-helix domain-containing protein [Ruegeria sp. 2012CJ41-6]|uniref:Helix-turn-helix domain-containing protein n=1 Tax=Ruegeria spongiae TaxID=2942209 RepID=A0ABT0Q887_9RHOB|nr:helix-turn-helix domain-containing protein [Ruegeria spongiae]MCL6286088.1 helix-turn-helix domain-containing protein [Ruegeria spongiae]